MIEIEIDDRALTARVTTINARLVDASPLMAGVADIMLSGVEEEMLTEGRGKWPTLSDTTKARRRAIGKWPGKMLQVSSAGLASANQPSHGRDFAQVSNNKVYAPTMHYGAQKGAFGTTRRGGPIPWGNIPARPWLVFTDEARETIREAASAFYLGN